MDALPTSVLPSLVAVVALVALVALVAVSAATALGTLDVPAIYSTRAVMAYAVAPELMASHWDWLNPEVLRVYSYSHPLANLYLS